MKVTVAESAGFCFGVKRAVDTVYEQVAGSKVPVYTYGPIIHNEIVVEDLASKGVNVLHGLAELRKIKRGVVVIRSHGVAKEVYEAIEKQKLTCVDATCPFVKKIHGIVEKESKKGRHIVIVGNADHPEVIGIKGWCTGPVDVVETREQVECFLENHNLNVCIVAQTTFNYNKFQELVEILGKTRYDRIVLNTICDATEKRQLEAERIAGEVDAMIVVGGKNSSNTQKLYDICKKECKNTYYIQELVDLDSKPFQSFGHVGITAGASTPNKIIEEVTAHVGIKF